MSEPRLPPEWSEWDGRGRLAHLSATRSREELALAILETLSLPRREWSGQFRRAELAAILVALLEATGDDPSSVVFDVPPQGSRGRDREDRP